MSKLISPYNWKLWILIALIVKSIFFTLKVYEQASVPNFYYFNTFAQDGGDTASYFESIEHLIKFGHYYDDYRMPGYGWIYFFLRFFLSITESLNVISIIQLILSAVSVYVFGKISLHIFQNRKIFYFSYVLYLLSTFTSLYDSVLLTESFCVSSLIFSVYFLIRFKKSNIFLLLSGLFLSWCIFLKPVLSPLIIIFLVYVLLIDNGQSYKISFLNWRSVLFFLIPFIIIDGTWTVRNYYKHNGFYPLTNSQYFNGICALTKNVDNNTEDRKYMEPLCGFINAIGGSIVQWNPGAEITFFLPPPSYIKRKIEVKFPEYIYTSCYNYDSLVTIKNMINEIEVGNIKNERKNYLAVEISKKFERYTKSIKEEKPFLYHLFSRINKLKTFLINSGSYNLFNKPSYELSFIALLVKIFYSLFYAFIVLFGFIGNILLLLKWKANSSYVLISLTGLYITFVYPFILMLDENRYFVPGYPFFLFASIFMIFIIVKKIKKAKTSNINLLREDKFGK